MDDEKASLPKHEGFPLVEDAQDDLAGDVTTGEGDSATPHLDKYSWMRQH